MIDSGWCPHHKNVADHARNQLRLFFVLLLKTRKESSGRIPYPALATLTKKVASSISSDDVSYGEGPGFVPHKTLPATRSLRVDRGTLNSLAAHITGIPRFTSSKAPIIDSNQEGNQEGK